MIELSFAIAFGILLGFILIVATTYSFIEINEKIQKNKRGGYSWYHGFI